MKRWIIIFFAFSLLLWPETNAQAIEMSAKELIRQVWEKYRGQAEEEHITVKIKDEKKRIKEKKFIRYLKFLPDGQDKILVLFKKPRRRGYLVFLKPDGLDIWRKKAKKVRRVAINDLNTPFEGTDLILSDLRLMTGAWLDNYKYSYVDKEKMVIKAVPKNPDNVFYGSRHFLVKQKNRVYYFAEIKYFNKAGQIIKTQLNTDIEVTNNKWRANQLQVINSDNRLKRTRRISTTFIVTKRIFNSEVAKSDNTYKKKYLKECK